MNGLTHRLITTLLMGVTTLLLQGCANIGTPDGGDYDETPPQLVGASPAVGSINSKEKKITLHFNEYIKLENASEKVTVSPPQLDMPEIKTNGKKITVELMDSLKPNTTYTIDFSDAIVDNNEGNPMGQFTYTFSTGSTIDTMEVAGYVLDAQNLEPIKGILVGLQPADADSLFTQVPLLRVSRTDGRGHYVIKGVSPQQKYHVFALQDANSNFYFDQKNERIAFNNTDFTLSSRPDFKPDTVWTPLHKMDSVKQVPFTHFLPDDLVLKAFTETNPQRYLNKIERPTPERITMTMNGADSIMPVLKGYGIDFAGKVTTEGNATCDTLTFWLTDSVLIKADTLPVIVDYRITDSLNQMVMRTDTLELVPRTTLARILKQKQEEQDEWAKEQRKKMRRNGQKVEKDQFVGYKPQEALEVSVKGTALAPDKNVHITLNEPIAHLDTLGVHFVMKNDSVEQQVPYLLRPIKGSLRGYTLYAEWQPGNKYLLTIDSATISNLYGCVNAPIEQRITVKEEKEFSTLYLNITGYNPAQGDLIVQLLNNAEKVQKEQKAEDGRVEFYYINPGKYFVRAFIDANHNGIWDTGDFYAQRQPETTVYYPQALDLKADWEIEQNWNLEKTPAAEQKPQEITKQKPDKEKTIKNRNAERARERQNN